MTAPSYREIQTKDFSPALGTGQSCFLNRNPDGAVHSPHLGFWEAGRGADHILWAPWFWVSILAGMQGGRRGSAGCFGEIHMGLSCFCMRSEDNAWGSLCRCTYQGCCMFAQSPLELWTCPMPPSILKCWLHVGVRKQCQWSP